MQQYFPEFALIPFSCRVGGGNFVTITVKTPAACHRLMHLNTYIPEGLASGSTLVDYRQFFMFSIHQTKMNW